VQNALNVGATTTDTNIVLPAVLKQFNPDATVNSHTKFSFRPIYSLVRHLKKNLFMEQTNIVKHSAGDGMVHSTGAETLATVLELVLDKGVVIAGDIQIKLADVELLTIKIRLLISSVDKAKEMGISWWEYDSYLSPKAKEKELTQENAKLKKKIAFLDRAPKKRK
jgi:hypothetical protein